MSDNPSIGHNSGANTSVRPEDFSKLMVRLNTLEAQKRALAQEIQKEKRQYKTTGGNPVALAILRRIQALDPDDREETLHEIDKYATFLRYW